MGRVQYGNLDITVTIAVKLFLQNYFLRCELAQDEVRGHEATVSS
jgi:hypothetical protein